MHRAAVVTAGNTLFLACHFKENVGMGAVFVIGGETSFENCQFASNNAIDNDSGASAIVIRTENGRTSQVSILNTCFDENQSKFIVFVDKDAKSKVVRNENNTVTNSLGGVLSQGVGIFYNDTLSSCENFDLIGTTCSTAAPLTTGNAGTPVPLSIATGRVPTPPTFAPISPTITGPDVSDSDNETDGDPPERGVSNERKDPQPTETEEADPLEDALAKYASESATDSAPNLMETWLVTTVALALIFRS